MSKHQNTTPVFFFTIITKIKSLQSLSIEFLLIFTNYFQKDADICKSIIINIYSLKNLHYEEEICMPCVRLRL